MDGDSEPNDSPFLTRGNDEDKKKSTENISSWPGWLIGVTVFAVILFLVTMIGLEDVG